VLQQEHDSQSADSESFNLEAYSKLIKNSRLSPSLSNRNASTLPNETIRLKKRELLAVVHALQHWRGYIEGSPIVVRSDHETLKYFKTQRHASRRLARFVDAIEDFDVVIIYRPGRHQLAADALSRIDLPVAPIEEMEMTDVSDSFNLFQEIFDKLKKGEMDPVRNWKPLRTWSQEAHRTSCSQLSQLSVYRLSRWSNDDFLTSIASGTEGLFWTKALEFVLRKWISSLSSLSIRPDLTDVYRTGNIRIGN